MINTEKIQRKQFISDKDFDIKVKIYFPNNLGDINLDINIKNGDELGVELTGKKFNQLFDDLKLLIFRTIANEC